MSAHPVFATRLAGAVFRHRESCARQPCARQCSTPGVAAAVQFAGLVSPGEFQFNVVIPPSIAGGDQSITATNDGVSTQSGTLITIHN